MKLTLILASVVLSTLHVAAQTDDYKQALRLYEKGMLSRSEMIFANVAEHTRKAEPAGYSLLCDVRCKAPGYERRIDAYAETYPYSVLLPQIRYQHALNLFDAGYYKDAARVFAQLKEKVLYKSQRTEFAFKKAYSALETGDVQSAFEGFKDVESRKYSDYTAPARFAIGYIEYNRKNFSDAQEWFEKSANDSRFRQNASYYILECRFLMKDYAYVVSKGRGMFADTPVDRKPHLARIISESYLVLGDVNNAREFYEHTISDQELHNTRADWFYSGSMLYAVKDYKGAVKSFLKMGERRDSIGQIANYHLGFSYIQNKDKVSAMNSFKDASQQKHDARIAEDAMFNYAKLAFDLNHDISIFNEYLKKYPGHRRGDRIYSYIAVAALLERDYEAAVEAYDNIDELDEDMTLNYMKANYLRANQLVKNGSYRKAVPCLKAAAYYSDKRSPFYQLSRFWLAESYYRDDKYAQAREVYTELFNMSALDGKPEAGLIPYGIAYCYFKEGNYPLAKKWFTDYLSEPNIKYRKEALVRKADCDFVAKDYKSASSAYEAVLSDYFNVNDIYPYYQAALSYGLCDNSEKKVKLLSNVLEASPESEFYPEAIFELGRTYAVKEDDENAFKCFNILIENVKDSSYVAKSYLEMGSLARNQSMFNEALGYYKVVVEKMSDSEYADDALLAIESIYQTKNDVKEYLAYLDAIGKGGSKSENEKESMIFNSAEQVFLSENYQKALVALQSYVDEYPKGADLYKAEFYMAESYRALERLEQACDCYANVIQYGEGSFVELSMLHFANLSYRLERWDDALSGYASLYETAKLPNNAYLAMLGQMRSAYRGHEWNIALDWVEKVTGTESAEPQLKREALFIKAKSLLAVSRRDEAMGVLDSLAADKNDAYGAEAAYMLIVDSYDRGAFEEVENKVYAFADAGSPQTYWLAKSFIVLGDSFAEREEMEQAKATFESVKDGYTPSGDEDDVLDNVAYRLKKLAELAAE